MTQRASDYRTVARQHKRDRDYWARRRHIEALEDAARDAHYAYTSSDTDPDGALYQASRDATAALREADPTNSFFS